MNKVDLSKYPEVSYQDLEDTLQYLNFVNQSDDKRFVYTYLPDDAKMILPLPKSPGDFVNKVHLWSNAFILQEKGVVTSIDIFYKIIESRKYLKENVLA